MSLNRFAERSYHYTGFHIVSRPPKGPFEVNNINAPEVDPASLNGSLRSLTLEIGPAVLTAGLSEHISDRYDSAPGTPANYVIRIKRVSLVSTHYAEDTGMHSFERADRLLTDPTLLTPRALGCLSILQLHGDEITKLHDPNLAQLLRQTA